MELYAHGIHFTLDEHTGSILLRADGCRAFRLKAASEDMTLCDVTKEEDAISLTLRRTDGVHVRCRYRIVAEPYPFLQLRLYGEGALSAPFYYPPAPQLLPEDQLLFAYNEGVIVSAKHPEVPLPSVMHFHSCETSSMSFFAALRQEDFLLCAAYTNLDAGLENETDADGLLSPQLFWESEKGAWGYPRECRLYPGKGSISEVCQRYRSIAEEKGLIVPLREKLQTVPKLRGLLGAADVWLWNDNAMQKLYDCEASDEAPTAQQRARRLQIARQMHEDGMQRVLWSIFDHHVSPEAVADIKALGYQTTFYDIYTDVIPKPLVERLSDFRVNRCRNRTAFWPDGVQQKPDGTRQQAWAIKGKDGTFYPQDYLCDAAALQCAEQTVPEHTQRCGLDGRFIDVIYGNSNECYSPKHPTTRSTSMQYKNRLMQSLLRQKLLVGTEVGREDGAPYYHYNEGMLSPILHRSYDAGRRMTHIYEGEQVDEAVRRYMLDPRYRVPLWELVFHDCVISYWYWGDSTNSCPDYIKRRDLFCRLYALPPLYSFAACDWERLRPMILASYERTVPLATKLGLCRMTRFDYLTPDRLVQKTVFSDGTQIVANFGSDPFVYQGNVIEAEDAYVSQ